MLKKNVGNIDRAIRIIVGIAALIAFFMMPTGAVLHWIFLAVGENMIGTSLVSSCPIYTIFGLRTCPPETQE